MAVPHLYMIEESANFSLTVEPFLPQLLDLPAQLSTVDSVGSLLQIYVETNPLVSGFSMSLAIAVITFFISTINRNWSQIDRLWSILPAFYAGHFSLWARLAGIQASRVHLAWAFTIIWSVCSYIILARVLFSFPFTNQIPSSSRHGLHTTIGGKAGTLSVLKTTDGKLLQGLACRRRRLS